jgi:hypothetical protein
MITWTRKSLRRETSTPLLARVDVVLAAVERIAQSGRYPVRRLASAANRIEARAAALDRAILGLRRKRTRRLPFNALQAALAQAVALLDAGDAALVRPHCDEVLHEAIVAVTTTPASDLPVLPAPKGRPWSSREDQQLLAGRAAGKSFPSCCQHEPFEERGNRPGGPIGGYGISERAGETRSAHSSGRLCSRSARLG